MTFDWKEYLNLAQHLQVPIGSSFTQEARFRSATSRAYYAAFCYARNFARDQHGFRPNYKSNDHWRVREHFQKRQMAEIATKLDKLRQWRNTCDYDDVVANVSHLVSSAITKAQEVFKKLT